MPDPDIPDSCDLLILESTYGDRNHDDRKMRVSRLKDVLEWSLADKGKVYIPAFALGRCQELIYEMDRITQMTKSSDKIPVFIDSPLGTEITHIYHKLSDYWDAEATNLMRMGDHPIDFKNLYAVNSFKDHAALTDMAGPCVIVAGSGMCTGGRIVSHLERGLSDHRNDVLFVGYQAKGTLGRAIIDAAHQKDRQVYINGSCVQIQASVHLLTGYSAHADQSQLIDWACAMEKVPDHIQLVHGDGKARRALAEKLIQKGMKRVQI